MIKINKNEIAEVITVCPYCYEEQGGKLTCCGESHFEEAYRLDDDTVHLCDECEVHEVGYYRDPLDIVKAQKEDAMCRKANGE